MSSGPQKLGRRRFLWGGTLLCASWACSREKKDEDATAPPSARRLGPAPAPEGRYTPPPGLTRLRLSVTPHLEASHMEAIYGPFVGYLARELQVEVEFIVAKSYDELGSRMREGDVDLGIFSPFAFVRAERTLAGIQPVADVISDGSETAACYVVARADSRIRTLDDLKGRRMAFVDRASTSGYLFPMQLLLERGLDPRTFFARADFFGNHQAALLAVHEGRADAAATYQGAIRTLESSHRIDPLTFRVIAKGARTPHNLICARPGLPQELVEALRARLLSLSVQTTEGRAILRPLDINGFVEPMMSLYGAVREADARITDAGFAEGLD